MKKRLLLIILLLALAWATLCNDWVLNWDGHTCAYQAYVLDCATASAPEYKSGRPEKFKGQSPEESYKEHYSNFYSSPL